MWSQRSLSLYKSSMMLPYGEEMILSLFLRRIRLINLTPVLIRVFLFFLSEEIKWLNLWLVDKSLYKPMQSCPQRK